MSPLTKKELEEHYLRRFLDTKSEIYLSIKQASDPPDFEMKSIEGERISIEITNVMNQNLKGIEEAQKKVVLNAKEMFKKVRMRELLKVYVDFRQLHQDVKLSPDFIEKNAKDLYDLVIDIVERNENCTYRIRINEWPYFHDFFRDVTVSNELGYESWQPFGAFKVPHIDENWFSERILKKEKKLDNYKNKYDQNWLLLPTNFDHKSTAFRFDMLTKNFSKSEFDKIYVFQDFQKEIITIK